MANTMAVTMKTAEHASFRAAWETFDAMIDQPISRAASIAIAGPVTGDVIGCVYLYPSESPDADVTVQSWVRASHAELDVPLADAVAAWLAAEWPWERVHRPGR